jgi:hypothetical protein
MEDEEVKFCIQTYEACRGFVIYSYISFKDLNDLREQLVTEGIKSVGLAKSGWYDDSEFIIHSGIKIMDIYIEHIEWCNEKTGEHRYLVLNRK